MGLQRVGHKIVPEHTHTNTTTVYILVHISFLQGFPCGSAGKESACDAGDLDLIPGLVRSPGGVHGNPLQFSSLENPHGQRSFASYSPWYRRKSDTSERLSIAHPSLGASQVGLVEKNLPTNA